MNDVSPELALVDDALAARERAQLPEPDDCLAPRPALPAAPPPALELLVLPAEPEPALVEVAPEPEEEHVPSTEVELEPPAPAVIEDEAIELVAVDEPAARVEPAAEPAPEPHTADVDEAPAAPEPVAPGRMPDWVASDAPPKSRRKRRKDSARERRDERRDERRGEKRPMRRRVAVAASWVVLCGFLASPLLAFIPSPNGERPTLAPDGVPSVPDAGESSGHVLRWEPVAKAAGYSVVFVNDGVRSDRWSENARLRLPAGSEAQQLVTYEWFVYPAFRDGAGYRYGPLVASGEVTMPRLAPTESS